MCYEMFKYLLTLLRTPYTLRIQERKFIIHFVVNDSFNIMTFMSCDV